MPRHNFCAPDAYIGEGAINKPYKALFILPLAQYIECAHIFLCDVLFSFRKVLSAQWPFVSIFLASLTLNA